MRRLDQRDPESAQPHGKPIPRIKVPSPICLPLPIVQARRPFGNRGLPPLRCKFSISGKVAPARASVRAEVGDRKGNEVKGQSVRLTDEQQALNEVDWQRLK
jgi:hypothetical protein